MPQPTERSADETRALSAKLNAPGPISRIALGSAAGLALATTLGVFMLYFVIYVVYANGLFAFPFDYDQGEGFEFFDGLRLSRGQGIYLDNAVFPYYASNYPPVYRLMLVPLIWLFGPKLAVARALTWTMSLGIGLVVFLAARAAGTNRATPRLSGASKRAGLIIAAISGLSFFAANYVYQIGPLARAHLPMVLFGISGVFCLDRALSTVRPRLSGVVAGVALLLIAGFTKLQAVDALAAGFGFLLLRRPRWGLVALLISAAIAGAIVLALNAATSGQFWLNVVAANVNEYSLDRTWEVYTEFWRLQAPLILAGTLHVAADLVTAVRRRSLQPVSIWSLYFLGGVGLGMLTGKWGAGPVYLIASIAAGAVCAARLAARLKAWLTPRHGALVGAALPSLLFSAALVWQAGLNVHLPTSGRLLGSVARALGVDGRSSYPPFQYYDSVGYTQLGHLLDPADTANGWELVNQARQANGPVWSEEAMLTLLADKDVVTNPTQLYNLSRAGMLDTRDMIARIRRREFGLVIFRAQFYPDDVKDAIGQNYRWARSIKMNGFDYWLLEPLATP